MPLIHTKDGAFNHRLKMKFHRPNGGFNHTIPLCKIKDQKGAFNHLGYLLLVSSASTGAQMKESVDAKSFISNATWGSLLFVSFASTSAQLMIHKRIFKNQKISPHAASTKMERAATPTVWPTSKRVMDGQEGSTRPLISVGGTNRD